MHSDKRDGGNVHFGSEKRRDMEIILGLIYITYGFSELPFSLLKQL